MGDRMKNIRKFKFEDLEPENKFVVMDHWDPNRIWDAEIIDVFNNNSQILVKYYVNESDDSVVYSTLPIDGVSGVLRLMTVVKTTNTYVDVLVDEKSSVVSTVVWKEGEPIPEYPPTVSLHSQTVVELIEK